MNSIIEEFMDTERKPISVGEMIVEEFMKPLNMTISELSEKSGLDINKLCQIVNGFYDITKSDAEKLSKTFGNSPEYWINLQSKMDNWKKYNT